MDISNESMQAIKNIRYYSERLKELARIQIDKDIQIGHIKGLEIDPSEKRFNALGIMETNSDWIDIYCNNIEANIKHAEEQDEKFISKEEQEQPEPEQQSEQSKF